MAVVLIIAAGWVIRGEPCAVMRWVAVSIPGAAVFAASTPAVFAVFAQVAHGILRVGTTVVAVAVARVPAAAGAE